VSVSVVSEVSEGLRDIQRSITTYGDAIRQELITEIGGVYGQVGDLNQTIREMRKDVGVLAGRKSMLTEMYEDFKKREIAEANQRAQRAWRLRRMRSLGLYLLGGVLMAMALIGFVTFIQDVLG
jgi:hypothetical protein